MTNEYDSADLSAALDRLEHASRERERELHELASELPAAVSRRRLGRSLALSLWPRRRDRS